MSVSLKACSPMTLTNCSSTVDSTRITAISRWGDILQDHQEICALLSCRGRNVWDVYVDNFRRTSKDLRSAVNSPTALEALDRISFLLEVHLKGLYILCVGCGGLQLEEKGFKVDWKGNSEITGEEITKWHDSFLFVTQALTYVSLCIHLFL